MSDAVPADSSAAPGPSRPEAPAAWSSTPGLARLAALLCVPPLVALAVALWPHWSGNPDLSHGLLLPLVLGFLLHEARTRGTLRFTKPSASLTGAALLLSATGLCLALLGALYASAMGWGHPLAVGLCGLAACAFTLQALLALSDQSLRLIPLNWTALAAALAWLLTIPLPPGAYARLSGSLQLGVSQGVLLALNLLGIPATRHGNIIELANGSVGVEEACSGVRSLVACVFAALLISAIVLRSPWKRLLILLLAPALALGMNFVRSLALTLAANSGINISGTLHDATGFAILAITAALLFGIAQLLERGKAAPLGIPSQAHSPVRVKAPQVVPATGPVWTLRILIATSALASLGTLALVLGALFPRPPLHRELPELSIALPAALPGWTQSTTADLKRFAPILGTELLLERTYTGTPTGVPAQVTLYAAVWAPGKATPAQVALHTPEVCWPGQGWIRQETPPTSAAELPAGAHQGLFQNPAGGRQYVYYWHLNDGQPVDSIDPRAPITLLRAALKSGFRAPAPQLFLRVSGNRPWAELKNLLPVRVALQNLGLASSGLSEGAASPKP